MADLNPISTFWNSVTGGIAATAASVLDPNTVGAAIERIGNKITFSNVEWQSNVKFGVTFFPNEKSVGGKSSGQSFAVNQLNLQNLSSAIINKIHLRAVSVPNLTFEYETLNYLKKIKNITYPDTITFHLLEDEYGTVKAFIKTWISMIVQQAPSGQFVFMDNQNGSLLDAVVATYTGMWAKTPNFDKGWLKLSGLKYQSSSEATFAHDNKEFQAFDLTCKVDNVWYVQTSLGVNTPFGTV